jgi:hypothetical protein
MSKYRTCELNSIRKLLSTRTLKPTQSIIGSASKSYWERGRVNERQPASPRSCFTLLFGAFAVRMRQRRKGVV